MKTTMVNRIMGVAFGLVLVASAAFCSSCDETSAPPCIASSEAGLVAEWESDTVCVYEKGEWVLKIEYLHKGSRSEGQKGTLLKNGQAITDKQRGDTLETSLGKLKHYGVERKVRWALSGWNFADRRQVKRSSQVPKKAATPPAAPEGKACCGACSGK
jgi:hypothetical protein